VEIEVVTEEEEAGIEEEEVHQETDLSLGLAQFPSKNGITNYEK